MSENTINVYTCSNGHRTVTIDREHGATPMFIECDECTSGKPADKKDLIIGRLNQPENMGGSCMYMCPQDLIPTHEWYKPNEKELKQMEKLMGEGWPSMKQHLDMGGLAYRKIQES